MKLLTSKNAVVKTIASILIIFSSAGSFNQAYADCEEILVKKHLIISYNGNNYSMMATGNRDGGGVGRVTLIYPVGDSNPWTITGTYNKYSLQHLSGSTTGIHKSKKLIFRNVRCLRDTIIGTFAYLRQGGWNNFRIYPMNPRNVGGGRF